MSDGTTGRVGAATSTPGEGGRATVFVFQLPSPAPDEVPLVISATFSFTITADQPDGTYNIDLYGLPARSTSTVLATDAYFGGPESPPLGDVLIQAAIIPSVNTNLGLVSTSGGAEPALVSYLNTQYGTQGSGIGMWAFLRLNTDTDPPVESSGVDVASANRSTGKPTLSIAFLPEPGSASLAFAFVGVLMRRTRKTY